MHAYALSDAYDPRAVPAVHRTKPATGLFCSLLALVLESAFELFGFRKYVVMFSKWKAYSVVV